MTCTAKRGLRLKDSSLWRRICSTEAAGGRASSLLSVIGRSLSATWMRRAHGLPDETTAPAGPASSGSAWGGGLALMLAADHAFSVASVNYGGLTSDSKHALPRACPIVASYGAKDRWPGISKVPGVLEPVLTAAGIDHDIKVYADAGSGFGCDPVLMRRQPSCSNNSLLKNASPQSLGKSQRARPGVSATNK
jgi:dienelactone hydrolase